MRDGDPITERHVLILGGIREQQSTLSQLSVFAGVAILLLLLMRVVWRFGASSLLRFPRRTKDAWFLLTTLVATALGTSVALFLSDTLGDSPRLQPLVEQWPNVLLLALPIAAGTMLVPFRWPGNLVNHPHIPSTHPLAQAWPPAGASLATRWRAALVPAARPVLTPRPASVTGVSTPVLSLNGTWAFSAAEGVAAAPIEVPGEWAMQGFEVPAGGSATYTREVQVPDDWRGQEVKLRFDAVHAVCEVLVNGHAVGGHEGGFVPFELDVTGAIRPGANTIVATEHVKNQPADGYTLLFVSASFAINPSLYKLPYDPDKDFAPITIAAIVPLLVITQQARQAQ